MDIIVQKFGGTSVGSLERIEQVANKIINTVANGNKVVVVLSAMGGETDRLMCLAKEIHGQPDARELDVLLSTGEQVAISLLAMTLIKKGYKARSFLGSQIKMLTDSVHNKARILDISTESITSALDNDYIAVVAGFQGIDQDGNITTLGRGGSDTTAVALAASISATECQIYTDVDGVYTTDPRVVSDARLLDRVTFEEMLELSSLGAKVLQIRAVEFAGRYKVPLRVLNSFKDGLGTLIALEDIKMEQASVSGIAFNRSEAKLTILGVPDIPGVASQVLCPISDANIEVDMIIQNAAEDGTTDFTFTVHRNDYDQALSLLQLTAEEVGARDILADNKIAKISLVGVGMRSHAGIASTMFRVLGEEGINIQMIATSEIKISVVVNEKYLELTVRSLHSAFGLNDEPEEDEI